MGAPLTIAEIKSVKDAEAAFLKAHKELMAFAEKASGEIEATTKVSNDTKQALEKLAEQANKAFDKLAILEGKYSYRNVTAPDVNIGRDFCESDQFKALAGGTSSKGRLQVKTMVNATGQNQPLVPSDRRPGIIAEPNRILRIRDLLPRNRTGSNLIEYTKENVFTNSAGSQNGEGTAKAKSNITFTLATAAVVTIAHYMKASKQVLSDAPQLESYINGRLQYGLALEEEEQILLGTGSAGTLNGLLNQATAYNRHATGDTRIDQARKAITQGQLAEYMMEAIVMNPADWESIELLKDSDGRYLLGKPDSMAPLRLWALPVVPTNTIPAGTALVGNFSMAAALWDREDAAIQVGFENDDFTKNLVTILAEERLALTVFRAAALVKVLW